jgi:hypothetical protein
MVLIPENILVGFNDTIPGISGSHLPKNPQDVITQCKLVQMKTIFAHNVRISSMNEVEESFTYFLQDW